MPSEESVLTFRQIEVFKAVMAAGSLAGAARELRIAQPTVTRMILRMEDQLGARLFNRVRSRLTPTQEAARFLAEIDRAYEQMRSAVERAAQAALPEHSVFRCGASPSIGRGLVPAALALLVERMPAVSLQLDILTVSQVLPYLLDGAADAAVTLFPVLHHEVVSTPVGNGRPMLLVPAGMDIPSAETSLAGLVDRAWIVFQPRSVHGDMAAGILSDHGLRPARTHLVRFAETAVALVEAGVGVCIVDEFSARAADMSRLRCLPVPTTRRYEAYLHRPLAARGEVTERFEQCLKDELRAGSMP
ncbi:LysR family transcriptional regulator [Bosea lupini]|uniref:LysR family transcriptional regulator n=1 Tax=Bosea lupini TaxID=1036779 RepID=UPI000B8230EA|nr:LysR family transcriptional regulator [Bosea lupini]